MKWLLLIVFLLIIFLPPALNGYTYPSVGDDAAVHLEVMDTIRDGGTPQTAYWGQLIVGYPLVMVAETLNVSNDRVYLWWSYSMIALAGVVLYLVLGSLVNRWAGVIGAVLAVFGTQGMMYLFDYGVMFNIVNVIVILPVGIWFLVKWLSVGRWWHGAGMVVMMTLFAVFHTSGGYLPYVMTMMVAMTLVSVLVMGMRWSVRYVALLIPVVVGLATVLDFAGTPTGGASAITETVALSRLTVEGMSIPTFMFSILGVVSIGLGLLGIVVIVERRAVIRREVALLLMILGSLCCVLVGGAFVHGLSPDPSRQAMDLAMVATVGIAVILGVAIEAESNYSGRSADSSDTEPTGVVRA